MEKQLIGVLLLALTWTLHGDMGLFGQSSPNEAETAVPVRWGEEVPLDEFGPAILPARDGFTDLFPFPDPFPRRFPRRAAGDFDDYWVPESPSLCPFAAIFIDPPPDDIMFFVPTLAVHVFHDLREASGEYYHEYDLGTLYDGRLHARLMRLGATVHLTMQMIGPDVMAVEEFCDPVIPEPGTPVRVRASEELDAQVMGCAAAEYIFRRRPHRKFLRGDADSNGRVNLTDAQYLLSHLTGRVWYSSSGGIQITKLPCEKSADADDSGRLDLTDPIYILNYLFLGGPQPPAPFPTTFVDPSPDRLSCD
jgi:hypothetical protein